MNYSRLFKFLKEHNINRTELITNGVISHATMGRLRRNENISLYTVELLCNYLKCTARELLSGDDEEY